MLAPEFDANGLALVPLISSGELPMHGYMNEEALKGPLPAAKRIIGRVRARRLAQGSNQRSGSAYCGNAD